MEDSRKKTPQTLTSPWYKEGLSFNCQKCGQCCTGFPGYVWLSHKDILRIAHFLKISEQETIKKFTRSVHGKVSLKEMPKTYDCIFFQNNRCLIYSARPIQCQTFPFWPHLLQSEKFWQNASATCPGMRTQKTCHFNREEIEKKLDEYKQNFWS